MFYLVNNGNEVYLNIFQMSAIAPWAFVGFIYNAHQDIRILYCNEPPAVFTIDVKNDLRMLQKLNKYNAPMNTVLFCMIVSIIIPFAERNLLDWPLMCYQFYVQ